MANEKRARKKQARDELIAAREAALRQRRMVRAIGAAVVIGAIVVFALFSGKDDGKPAADEASPSPTEAVEGGVACDAEAPPPADPKQYDEPEQVLEEGVDYAAVIETSCGPIEMDLLEEDAPQTVNSFVFLAREGFFDGLTFHRIVGNFVIQGGDPEGTGMGGPGYAIEDEFPKKGNEYVFGTVAMANSGPGTSGSQFFIVTHLGANDETDEPAGLDPLYSIFGRVEESSFDVVKTIDQQEVFGGNDPQRAEVPIATVYIESVEIVER